MCPFFKVAISCTLYMAQLSTPYMYVRRGIGGWMSHGFYPLKNLLFVQLRRREELSN